MLTATEKLELLQDQYETCIELIEEETKKAKKLQKYIKELEKKTAIEQEKEDVSTDEDFEALLKKYKKKKGAETEDGRNGGGASLKRNTAMADLLATEERLSKTPKSIYKRTDPGTLEEDYEAGSLDF